MLFCTCNGFSWVNALMSTPELALSKPWPWNLQPRVNCSAEPQHCDYISFGWIVEPGKCRSHGVCFPGSPAVCACITLSVVSWRSTGKSLSDWLQCSSWMLTGEWEELAESLRSANLICCWMTDHVHVSCTRPACTCCSFQAENTIFFLLVRRNTRPATTSTRGWTVPLN